MTGQQAQQIRNVLRIGDGEHIILLDNQGAEFEVFLTNVRRSEVAGQVVERRRAMGEPDTQITLYQSLLKREKFEWVLQKCVEKNSKSAPRLAEWIEENIPEGLAVFALPGKHRRRMRTTNMLERLHEEIKRRTRVARLFPNEASLLRLVSAIEMELSEDWIAGKRYFDMNVEMENENESADSKEKRIYRKNVA